MRLFDLVLADRGELAEEARRSAQAIIEAAAERSDAHAELAREVVYGLEAFTADCQGLDSSSFQEILAQAVVVLDGDASPGAVRKIAARLRAEEESFARRQREHFTSREGEYRKVIEWLTGATKESFQRDRAFQDDLLEAIERVEEVSLEGSVEELRDIVQNEMGELRAKSEDRKHVEEANVQALVRQVTDLQERLASAEEMAIRDKLTGVHNRRALDERLATLMQTHAEFCLVMVDLNDFKQINDTHGHVMGDRCLRTAASLLEQAFRGDDFVARYGGDEFVVLAETDAKQRLANRIHRVFPPGEPRVYRFDQDDRVVSVQLSGSFGVTIRRSDDTVESLLSRADARLYKAKAKGRNIICWR